jgi:hypothetical protein
MNITTDDRGPDCAHVLWDELELVAELTPFEYEQRLYGVFERKHDMECTTQVGTLGTSHHHSRK